ncbi:MAG: PHP domain-containing protein, partial [Chloroflexi bacterium]|nr:PHP domain-containing protein [Chloroflexota bacterium]
MRIDIHVHTTRYSDCGRSSPEEMIERAITEGLEALVFTEHNVFWPAEELAALQARYPQILLLRGAEFTTAEGEDLLVYGPTDEDLIAIHRDGARLVRQVHARGGAIVLAHPYRYHPDVPPWLDEHPVDGIEIMSSNIYEHTSKQGRALARKLGLPVIA